MSARIIEGKDCLVRMLTTEMPQGTVFPPQIITPFSTFCSSNFYAGYPDPTEAFFRFNPALRALHTTGTYHVRESTCKLQLHPFSNTENRVAVTSAVDYHMPYDIRRLKPGRMRRVLSSLPRRADVDLVQQDVSPEDFVRQSRPDFKRNLFNAYFPFMNSRTVYESPVLRDVLSFLGLAHLGKNERYVSKFTVTAITRADGGRKYDTVTRPMMVVIEEGSWDKEGKKPYFDAQFGVMEGAFGGGVFNKIFSIGVKPVFTEGRNDDTRDAPWVVSWDRNVYARLMGVEDMVPDDRNQLATANQQAKDLIIEGRLYPERRVQYGGIFAQNLLVDADHRFKRLDRLTKDMMFVLDGPQLKEQIRPIHIDLSITERPIIEQMEQFRRAARHSIYYGSAVNHSEEGRACMEKTGLAIDEATINLIRSNINPQRYRLALLNMNPEDRKAHLDSALADDLVSMHPIYGFIDTYRKLGLFQNYKLLSQITDAEWDRAIDAMKRERKVGDPMRFQRAQYAVHHANEYVTVDYEGRILPTFQMAQWDLSRKFVNPYALFVRAIRKAKVRSRDVRDAIQSPYYLENLDRLLNLDPMV